jgi:hypothetical protein
MKSSFATLVEEIGREADRRDAMRAFNQTLALQFDRLLAAGCGTPGALFGSACQ